MEFFVFPTNAFSNANAILIITYGTEPVVERDEDYIFVQNIIRLVGGPVQEHKGAAVNEYQHVQRFFVFFAPGQLRQNNIVLVNGRIKRARDANAVVCSDTVNRKYDTVLYSNITDLWRINVDEQTVLGAFYGIRTVVVLNAFASWLRSVPNS